jgi:hypothetical protein
MGFVSYQRSCKYMQQVLCSDLQWLGRPRWRGLKDKRPIVCSVGTMRRGAVGCCAIFCCGAVELARIARSHFGSEQLSRSFRVRFGLAYVFPSDCLICTRMDQQINRAACEWIERHFFKIVTLYFTICVDFLSTHLAVPSIWVIQWCIKICVSTFFLHTNNFFFCISFSIQYLNLKLCSSPKHLR